ncbi:unnamed protein product [Symbiodinium sp. CCMP2592]|nr:unnamed protein product [Symbiodinium sp. CCMP2592]
MPLGGNARCLTKDGENAVFGRLCPTDNLSTLAFQMLSETENIKTDSVPECVSTRLGDHWPPNSQSLFFPKASLLTKDLRVQWGEEQRREDGLRQLVSDCERSSDKVSGEFRVAENGVLGRSPALAPEFPEHPVQSALLPLALQSPANFLGLRRGFSQAAHFVVPPLISLFEKDAPHIRVAFHAAGVAALRAKGLVVHEEETAEGSIKILGWQFEGTVMRPLNHRVWRILAIEFLLRIGSCSGRQLENVLGHACFIGLGRRESLAVLGESYTFVQKHYGHSHRLWPSVRRELQIWIGISPLIWRDLSAPWGRQVTCVDASTWGLGAVVADFPAKDVRSLGQYSERWRFELPEFKFPRASVFGAAVGLDSEDSANLQWAAVDAESQERFDTVDRIWRVVGRYKWRRQEGMPVLEGRGRAFGMRRVTQQVAALCLCTGSSAYFRFIPSEWNAADGPSRGSLFASKPQQVHGDPSAFADTHNDEGGPATRQQFNKAPDSETTVQSCSSQVQRAQKSGAPSAATRGHESGRGFSEQCMQGPLSSVLEKGATHPAIIVDRALCEVLEDLFDEGEDFSQAQFTMAAVLFYQPALWSPKQTNLPLAKQTLQGWRKLDPPKSRLPLPWEVTCLLAQEAMQLGCVEIGLFMLLCFVAYLRPGEATRLRVMDLVRPLGSLAVWSLILHPAEVGVPSKTSEFDETVTIDIQPIIFVATALEHHLALNTRPRTEPMFSVTVEQVREFMKKTFARLRMEEAIGDPHPYRLRHGGPSRDIAMKWRTLADVQKRGRWKSFNSVRRYEKGGRNYVLPALSPHAVINTAVFLEIFSGEGGLSKAVHKWCGHNVLLWDIRLGPEYDLRSPVKCASSVNGFGAAVFWGYTSALPAQVFHMLVTLLQAHLRFEVILDR